MLCINGGVPCARASGVSCDTSDLRVSSTRAVFKKEAKGVLRQVFNESFEFHVVLRLRELIRLPEKTSAETL